MDSTLGIAILSGILSFLSDQKSVSVSGTATPSEELPSRTPTNFLACVTRAASANRIKTELSHLTCSLSVLQNENLRGVNEADIVLLACKPYNLSDVLHEKGMREALRGKLLISILAGVTVSQIEDTIYGPDRSKTLSADPAENDRCRIVRVIPNTAALIRESMTVIATPDPALPTPLHSLVTWIFTRIGRVVTLPPNHMDACTALCGSGPATFALVLEAIADGAVAMGLPRAEAQLMAAQTMRGAAGLVLNGEHPAMVREKVSTPGGLAVGATTGPLPPSVEEAYRRKCIELKRRMAEVEESNDAFRLRKVRLTRGIRKMRLERAYLLETLGKRMLKNGSSVDGMPGYYDEDSEGSSEGPPTPNERPLRSKRSHRRPLASPPPVLQYQISQHQSYAAPSGYEHNPHQHHSSPYGHPPPNGLPHPHQYTHPPQFPMQQPTLVPSSHAPQHQHNSMLSPIPAPSAFAMFFENNYLSQPHKHSGARTEEDLLHLARRDWASDEPAHSQVRKMYEAQEQKQRQRYAESSQGFEVGQTQGRVIQPKVEQEESPFEAEKERAERREREELERTERSQRQRGEREKEDLEKDRATASGIATEFAAGFTSINK
ncbi:MAG: hypothetical protein Q9217_000669 [Psora testacea]